MPRKIAKWYCHIQARCYSFSPRLRKHKAYKVYDRVGRTNTNCKLNMPSSMNADCNATRGAHTFSSNKLQTNWLARLTIGALWCVTYLSMLHSPELDQKR